MAKPSKKARHNEQQVIQATDENVARVGQSEQIKELVKLAQLFVRIGGRGPIEVDIPVLCSVEVPDKANPAKKVYRKHSIPPGTLLEPEFVRLGKRDGLIFRFKPKTDVRRDSMPIEAVEMQWEDVINVCSTAVERLDQHLGDATKAIRTLNEALTRMIAANPGMHKLLSEGFVKAQNDATQEFKEEQLETNELFGQWG